MSPFQPAGERARWRVIYEDLLVQAQPGDVVTYEQLGQALELDPVQDRHLIQMAMRRAMREHLVVNSRASVAVPGVGYQVVEPRAQLELAGRHQVKARRSVGRGHDQVVFVDASGMDQATRALFEIAATRLAQQDEAIRRLDMRQRKLDRQVAAATSAQQVAGDKIAELLSRVEALETGGKP